jgi:hypothetical protein
MKTPASAQESVSETVPSGFSVMNLSGLITLFLMLTVTLPNMMNPLAGVELKDETEPEVADAELGDGTYAWDTETALWLVPVECGVGDENEVGGAEVVDCNTDEGRLENTKDRVEVENKGPRVEVTNDLVEEYCKDRVEDGNDAWTEEERDETWDVSTELLDIDVVKLDDAPEIVDENAEE